ncbi:MAG: DUF6707 family protein [Candidatus Sericytochromatia bacterium]
MQKSWKTIEDWLGAKAPKLLSALRPGATEAEIKQAEAKMGIKFPKEVRASWLIHDGIGRNGPFFLDGHTLLSLEDMVSDWRVCQELLDEDFAEDDNQNVHDAIRPRWWQTGWIPLTADGMGNHFCLDLAPARAGKKGQVISFWHDDDARELIAANFKDYLGGFAKSLSKGDYLWSDGRLVRKNEEKGFRRYIKLPEVQAAISLPVAMDPESENDPFLKELKKKACTDFKLTKDSSLSDAMLLAYWLYIYRQQEAALSICEFLAQVQPGMVKRLVYSSIERARVLKARILKSQNRPEEAKACCDPIWAYGFVTDRLRGSILCFDLLEEELQKEKPSPRIIRQYRCNLFRELIFIKEMGGSELWPPEKTELEIELHLQALREQQKIN